MQEEEKTNRVEKITLFQVNGGENSPVYNAVARVDEKTVRLGPVWQDKKLDWKKQLALAREASEYDGVISPSVVFKFEGDEFSYIDLQKSKGGVNYLASSVKDEKEVSGWRKVYLSASSTIIGEGTEARLEITLVKGVDVIFNYKLSAPTMEDEANSLDAFDTDNLNPEDIPF